MIEKRSATRHRVYKRGTISFNGAGFDCTVRNLSARGARIDVDGLVPLPEHFDLVIESDKVTYRCRMIWSSAQRIGVVFE
jgi:hypothetical protein